MITQTRKLSAVMPGLVLRVGVEAIQRTKGLGIGRRGLHSMEHHVEKSKDWGPDAFRELQVF